MAGSHSDSVIVCLDSHHIAAIIRYIFKRIRKSYRIIRNIRFRISVLIVPYYMDSSRHIRVFRTIACSGNTSCTIETAGCNILRNLIENNRLQKCSLHANRGICRRYI